MNADNTKANDTNHFPLKGLGVLGAGGLGQPYFIDTTLRDGEQSPGVVFSLSEKMRIAALLDMAGVPEIEIGSPAMGRNEVNDIKTLCDMHFKFKTLAWCRAKIADIQFASRAGTDGVHISFPVSPILMQAMDLNPKWIERQMKELIAVSQSLFGYVTIGAQDAARADKEFLLEFASLAHSLGARRVRLADTVGVLNPLTTHHMVSGIRSVLPDMELEIHAHNDLGMATANTLAAYLAGAKCLSTTVNGLGERAGNAAMEEVAMALEFSAQISSTLKTETFTKLSRYVAKVSKRPNSPFKPVTGEMALTHESGVHTSCLLKNPRTYQLFDACRIGQNEPEFLIGKHSGKATIFHYLEEAHLPIDDETCADLLLRVKACSEALKRAITKEELIDLYYEIYINKNPSLCLQP